MQTSIPGYFGPGANPFVGGGVNGPGPGSSNGSVGGGVNGPPAAGVNGPPGGAVNGPPSISGGVAPMPGWHPQAMGGGMPAPMQMGPMGPMIHDGQQWHAYDPSNPVHVAGAYGGQVPPSHPVIGGPGNTGFNVPLGGLPGGSQPMHNLGPNPSAPIPGTPNMWGHMWAPPGAQGATVSMPGQPPGGGLGGGYHTNPVGIGTPPGGQPPDWKGNPGATPGGLSPHQQYHQWVMGGRQGASGANLPGGGGQHPGPLPGGGAPGFDPRFPGGGIGANPPGGGYRPPATLPYQPPGSGQQPYWGPIPGVGQA